LSFAKDAIKSAIEFELNITDILKLIEEVQENQIDQQLYSNLLKAQVS